MKKYRALIIEDIAAEAEFLKDVLTEHFPQIEILSVANTIEKAKNDIAQLQPQLAFFDVELGSDNSFDILKNKPSHPFKIIFVTGHAGYMLDAIRISAADYLLKPYHKTDLINAVNRALDKIDSENMTDLAEKISLLYHNLSVNNNQSKVLPLINKDGQYRVPISEILYCSTSKESTREGNVSVRIQFRLTNGESILVSNTSVSNYEEILNPFDFARVAQPFLINMHHIKVYQKKGGKIIMKGYPSEGKIIEEDIYISDTKKNWFDKLYNEFFK